MIKYRSPSKDCVPCGGQIPVEINKLSTDGFIEYTCEKCGYIIMQGIVSSGGDPARTGRRLPPPLADVSVGDDITWDTWESWWTDRMTVSMIHGRVVAGDESLKTFVEKIQNIYDDDP